MNENEFYVAKQYKVDNPLLTDIDSKIDKCFRDCHKMYFHNFKYECIYEFKFTNITNNEIITLIISGKCMNVYELNKKLIVARQNGFMFNQITKLTIKIYSHLRYINMSYYLQFPMPMCPGQFFRKISQNSDIYDIFAMIKEIFLFTLHVGSGN